MNRILRQMTLGFGTFGTGCALLALNVNPYLLVLTDTVVGVGMLFAAGSLSVNDLPLKKRAGAGEGPAADAEIAPAGGGEAPSGLLSSLGKLRAPGKPSLGRKGKEEREAQVKEIDRMLDSTLGGQSKRLITLAEGQGASGAQAGSTGAAAAAAVQGGDLLEEFSKTGVGAPFGDEEAAEEPAATLAGGGPGTAGAGREEAGTAPLPGLGEISEAVTKAGATPVTEDLGADDLLSALRKEAMREKKKDDSSLLRDLKGVKVSGKELLEELDSLVRDLRGR